MASGEALFSQPPCQMRTSFRMAVPAAIQKSIKQSVSRLLNHKQRQIRLRRDLRQVISQPRIHGASSSRLGIGSDQRLEVGTILMVPLVEHMSTTG